MTMRGAQPVTQISWMRSLLIDWKPATISKPAIAGIATMLTAWLKSSTASTTSNPEKMLAQRDLAPELTLSAVLDTEPPMGMPWSSPAPMLAAPWPIKSRELLG